MATIEACEQAVQSLVESLAGRSAQAAGFDRTVSCEVSDLAIVFSALMAGGEVSGLTRSPQPKAQIRITTSSDDLVALAAGTLQPGAAWASGRLKISASFADMLKLRKLL